MAVASSRAPIRAVAHFADDGHPGSGDDLAVRVAKFVPRVVCSALPYPREAMVLNACGAIVDRMEASKQERIFAQQDIHDPNLEISLPAYYTAPAEGSTYPISPI